MRGDGGRREPGGLPTLDAVAIDLGASSIRFAHGRLVGGKIELHIVEQVPNTPKGRCWDVDLLVGFCLRAVAYAKEKGATVGIDSWGVDHGFLDRDGHLICGPVMYRDASHLEQFELLAPHRHKLFELTGIAHQPFNTLYQLAARKKEDPELPDKGEWLLMPDLMNFYLTGERRHEESNASTTQLLGLEGQWCEEAFNTVGWPVTTRHPSICPSLAGVCDGVPIHNVASHDTASAVVGVGTLTDSDAYLNVGTWALLGTLLDQPVTSSEAEAGGWTNEHGHWGNYRFLKNIPGFYVVNRLHDELGVKESVSEWLRNRDTSFLGRIDPHDKTLYNPDSMPTACSEVSTQSPSNEHQWAQLALQSLVDSIANDVPDLANVTHRNFKRIRVVGGGSRSDEFCQALADTLGVETVAGTAEATVLGNLAVQFWGSGEVDPAGLGTLVSNSVEQRVFQPQGE